MLFNSFEFLLFFPAVTLLYFLLPHTWRWAMLLLASCFFYMFFIPKYILILVVTILIDYTAGIAIEESPQPRRKKLFLILSIVANMGMLCFFKYVNFFSDNINEMLSLLGIHGSLPYLNIILPVGLSFHTFQALSYTLEVYKGSYKAERHLGYYALYVMYYPQLVAGPIERPQHILPQLRTEQFFNSENMINGLGRILWGLFKKVVVANRIALFIHPIFLEPGSHSGLQLLMAAYLFSIQIYCDFSGYSDIAVGTARCMGINLMENFNMPYFAKNIREFWNRWHISLSSWFRDYVYIPLGGNRVKLILLVRNVMVVFLLSGFWHGANWNFIVWGGIHGILILLGIAVTPMLLPLEKFLKNFHLLKLYNAFRVFLCFHVVTIAWIFFKTTHMHEAMLIVRKILSDTGNVLGQPATILQTLLLQKEYIGNLLMLVIGATFLVDWLRSNRRLPESGVMRYTMFAVLIVFIIILGQSTNEPFIYFQF